MFGPYIDLKAKQFVAAGAESCSEAICESYHQLLPQVSVCSRKASRGNGDSRRGWYSFSR